MTSTANNIDVRSLLGGLVKQLIFWGIILTGVVHQFLMLFFGIDRIYVFLDPPEYIYPLASLEFGWWILLTLTSFILCILAATRRLRPQRLVYPFYIYTVYLLIFIKPV